MDQPEIDPAFLFRDESYRIRGAIFEVYRTMGAGFLEAVYQECLAMAFTRHSVPHEALKPLKLSYQGQPLRQSYVTDFVCFGMIIVELKALRAIADEHRAQVINYLRASGMKLGLLVNFGAAYGVEIERFALSASASSAHSAVSTSAQ